MRYENIREGIFLERLNRFAALVQIDGHKEKCHVKNTGRCRELLLPGAKVYVEENFSESRATRFSLITVEKGNRLVNLDSQAPNQVVGEWLKSKGCYTQIKPEARFGGSRLDFYVETSTEKRFLEVKGVTLEEEGILRFPDAPTERGLKHIMELISAREQGYEATAFFVIQMEGADYFTPNYRTHREFGEALLLARKKGVELLAMDCLVEKDSICLNRKVEIRLGYENEA